MYIKATCENNDIDVPASRFLIMFSTRASISVHCLSRALASSTIVLRHIIFGQLLASLRVPIERLFGNVFVSVTDTYSFTPFYQLIHFAES